MDNIYMATFDAARANDEMTMVDEVVYEDDDSR